MILAVTEQFHDHEPHSYYLDTDKLDASNYIDSLILAECKKKKKIIEVFVDASSWEDNPKFNNEEPGVSGGACFKKSPAKIDKSLNLTIDFDC